MAKQKISQPPSPSAPKHPSNLTFLKFGGSLITDKSRPSTPRLDVLARLAREIAAARTEDTQLRIILGHGSGSFGHVPAKKYGTRAGVATEAEWRGFTEVWWQAATLNRLVIESLHKAELPAISFPVSAGAMSAHGEFAAWDISPMIAALDAGLLPVVYGDVVFDKQRGGTIFSTEDIFGYLALKLEPQRILLAGLEEGVFADYPDRHHLIPEITPQNIEQVAPALSGSNATDVTGGMASKVNQMLALIEAKPSIMVSVFSGDKAENVKNALLGASYGSQIHNNIAAQ